MSKKTYGARNRSSGFNWERSLAKIFRELGFPNIVTTRSESRSRDNQKVDLINKDEFKNGRFPLNVQAKTTTTHLPYAKLLKEMPKGEETNIILQRMTKKVGERFMVNGEYAILHLCDFIKLFKQCYPNETSIK